jgi:hypothetical protein
LLQELDLPIIKSLPFYDKLKDVELEWRNFLSEFQFPTNYNKMNLFFSSRVGIHNLASESVDYYFTRALDSCVVANTDYSYIAIYGKFLRFIFWHTVKCSHPVNYDEISIHPLSGIVNFPQRFDDFEMASFFPNRIATFDSLLNTSQKQEQIILEELKKDPGSFFASDAGLAILNDIALSKINKKEE